MTDVVMPQLGETVADGTVAKWFKAVGDTVTRGEPLFEVSTDKVDTEIPAPIDGVLSIILVAEGATVDVGTVLARIGDGVETAPESTAPAAPAVVVVASTEPAAVASAVTRAGNDEKLSPVVRRLLAENNLDASQVVGTGPQGRITRDDVLAAVAAAAASATADEAVSQGNAGSLSPVVRRLLAENNLDATSIQGTGPQGRLTRKDVEDALANGVGAATNRDEVRVPFTKVRRLTAAHMVRSKATSPHTLMVKEIDFERVEQVRRTLGAAFKAREGYSLTYLPFVAAATVQALREFPHLNASVGDDELIVHGHVNLGIAVDLDTDGLVVPVLHDADDLSVPALAAAIRDRALRARGKKLAVTDMEGGTFTISNPGPYGTLLTGAIINQPQVAILATDGVSRKPVVVTDSFGGESIAIHSVGLVALTFDHRAIDGGYAARFLARLNEIIQTRDWTAGL
jgi:2-oxoglutarate dehydrogenase E2 component (dihydrolipoamide succinyltransferase)